MKIQSIEDLKIRIQDRRTYSAMDEVLSCFYSHNGRSAIVMLYSAVISDLYYKLQDLVELYNDPGAQQIKDYVDNEWATNPKSPTWEKEIVEKCYTTHKIIENADYAHLQALQNERNLCAHPALVRGTELYRPSDATVQSLIEEMMKGILCKPSFLSKQFFAAFVDDIDNAKKLFADDTQLIQYVQSKYLDKIDNEAAEFDIFKQLWKFTFKLTDDKCQENRHVNYVVLMELYHRNEQSFKLFISKHKDSFGNNVETGDTDCLKEFIMFINENRDVYPLLSQNVKLTIESTINSKDELRSIALFLVKDILAHVQSVKSGVSIASVKYLMRYIRKNVNESEAIDFIIRLYGDSPSFNVADTYYDHLIRPHITFFSMTQLKKLLEVSNENGQIYSRKRASVANRYICGYIKSKDPAFDMSPYHNL